MNGGVPYYCMAVFCLYTWLDSIPWSFAAVVGWQSKCKHYLTELLIGNVLIYWCLGTSLLWQGYWALPSASLMHGIYLWTGYFPSLLSSSSLPPSTVTRFPPHSSSSWPGEDLNSLSPTSKRSCSITHVSQHRQLLTLWKNKIILICNIWES